MREGDTITTGMALLCLVVMAEAAPCRGKREEGGRGGCSDPPHVLHSYW